MKHKAASFARGTAAVLLLILLLGCHTPAETPDPAPEASPAPVMTPSAEDVSAQPQETQAPKPENNAVVINGEIFDKNAADLTLSLQSAEEASDALSAFLAPERVTLLSPALTPDEYRALLAEFPDVSLTAPILLGGQALPMDSTEIDFGGDTPKDWENAIALFPDLQDLALGKADPLTVRDVLHARDGLSVSYAFCGQTVSEHTTELDLRNAPVPTAEQLDALLVAAPQLETVFIAQPDEAAIEELLTFNPREKGVDVPFALTVLGQTFDTDAEVMDFGKRKITDEETAEIERILPLMTRLNEIDLYESRLKQETMDALFDGHPDLFFGWTFGIWNDFFVLRSDVTAFSSGTNKSGFHNGLLTEDDFRNLRYCKGLQALDLGHNGIKNLEFLRNWPHLKVLILADTRVTDLSVIAELQELQYLELFLTTPDSYEPLTHLPNLLDLNLCHTKKEGKQYRDDEEILLLTQIKSLERLWISKTLTADQAKMLREGLPGVEFDFSSSGSTDKGWRKHPRYFTMREGFNQGKFIPFD